MCDASVALLADTTIKCIAMARLFSRGAYVCVLAMPQLYGSDVSPGRDVIRPSSLFQEGSSFVKVQRIMWCCGYPDFQYKWSHPVSRFQAPVVGVAPAMVDRRLVVDFCRLPRQLNLKVRAGANPATTSHMSSRFPSSAGNKQCFSPHYH